MFITSVDGIVDDCTRLSKICNYGCCHKIGCADHLGGGVYILPGELDNHNDIDHLEIRFIFPDNGKIAVCRAEDCSVCDHKYKPIDCRLFPIFPKFKDDLLSIFLYSAVHKDGFYCPFGEKEALNLVNKLIPLLFKLSLNPNYVEFYNKRQLIGYKHIFNIKQWKSKFKSSNM